MLSRAMLLKNSWDGVDADDNRAVGHICNGIGRYSMNYDVFMSHAGCLVLWTRTVVAIMHCTYAWRQVVFDLETCSSSSHDIVMLTEGRPKVPLVEGCDRHIMRSSDTLVSQAVQFVQHAHAIPCGLARLRFSCWRLQRRSVWFDRRYIV